MKDIRIFHLKIFIFGGKFFRIFKKACFRNVSTNLASSVILIYFFLKIQDPVVQSFVSLMSSLRVISLTVLADSPYNIPIFFAEKIWVAFALQKLLTFF